MKTTRIFLMILVSAGILATACDDLLGDLLKFDSGWYSVEFTIDPSDAVGDIVFKTEEVDANIDSVLEANGVSLENLESARLSDARFSILTEGYNFDPVSRVELFIETPSLGNTRLAWLDSVPIGVTTIELELNNNDLMDYLLEDKFTLTASGTLSSKVEHTLDLKAELRFLIKGGLAQ